MDDGKKSVKKLFCLSKTEAKLLRQKAKELGLNDSEYLRLMISQKPNDYPEIVDLLKELINEVNHIGVNINQIVKNHNSSFYKQDDKDRLYSYMRRLNILKQQVVEKLGN